MKLTLMIIGAAIIVFGIVDIIGNNTGFDVWTIMGVELPEKVWQYSSYIELIIGGLLFKVGNVISAKTDEKTI
ncbi:MAG: hypothetical protein HRU38_20250 [Saccharospirillaceae bacterium]|nr:hypothetical protein [Pseudomonadales bacterium]NRB80965.1 hypothetical protein [Saccharospirillaceae bacterium]